MAFSVSRLGMSLMHMGKASERVRFLDDVDFTVSLDSRSSLSQKMTSIEIAVKPVIFRASYSDLNLMTSIINKAISLYGSINTKSPPQVNNMVSTSIPRSPEPGIRHPRLNARVLISKEQVIPIRSHIRRVLITY